MTTAPTQAITWTTTTQPEPVHTIYSLSVQCAGRFARTATPSDLLAAGYAPASESADLRRQLDEMTRELTATKAALDEAAETSVKATAMYRPEETRAVVEAARIARRRRSPKLDYDFNRGTAYTFLYPEDVAVWRAVDAMLLAEAEALAPSGAKMGREAPKSLPRDHDIAEALQEIAQDEAQRWPCGVPKQRRVAASLPAEPDATNVTSPNGDLRSVRVAGFSPPGGRTVAFTLKEEAAPPSLPGESGDTTLLKIAALVDLDPGAAPDEIVQAVEKMCDRAIDAEREVNRIQVDYAQRAHQRKDAAQRSESDALHEARQETDRLRTRCARQRKELRRLNRQAFSLADMRAELRSKFEHAQQQMREAIAAAESRERATAKERDEALADAARLRADLVASSKLLEEAKGAVRRWETEKVGLIAKLASAEERARQSRAETDRVIDELAEMRAKHENECEATERLSAKLREVERQSEWQTEGKPNADELVLISTAIYPNTVPAYWSASLWKEQQGAYLHPDRVLAWRPLPPPYTPAAAKEAL